MYSMVYTASWRKYIHNTVPPAKVDISITQHTIHIRRIYELSMDRNKMIMSGNNDVKTMCKIEQNKRCVPEMV